MKKNRYNSIKVGFAKKTYLVSIVLGWMASSALAQTNYFVSPAGSNSNIGSLTKPWKTIQYGLNKLSSSDTLNVMAGTYTEKVYVPSSDIVLRNYKTDKPVIDANGITSQDAIIEIYNMSNVIVDGLELKNSIMDGARGILINGSGNNLTIRNCNVHDIHFSSNPNAPIGSSNANGILVKGNNGTVSITNVKIQNNMLHDCRLGYSEGITINGNVDGFEVSGNTVYNLTNIGIDAAGHWGASPNAATDQARNGKIKNNIVHNCISPIATSAGLYVDGGKNVIIENNVSYHNGSGIEVGCERPGYIADGMIVRNNIVFDNQEQGIGLGGYDYPSGSGKVTNSSVLNNTCYYNDYSNGYKGEIYLSYSEGCVVKNNIFYASTTNLCLSAKLTQPSLTFNYNVFYVLAGPGNAKFTWNGTSYGSYPAFTSGSGKNANGFFADPAFVQPGIINPNFHLNGWSPVINMGDPAFVPAVGEVDMDGNQRANGRVDCGADEYDITTGITTNRNAIDFTVFPNPATGRICLSFSGKAEVTIINAMGEVVLQKSMESEWMDVQGFAAGLYIIQLRQAGIINTARCIIH